MRYLVLLLLAGCATVPSERAAQIREALPQHVTGCAFVGTVHGTSVLTGHRAPEGYASAKAEASDYAAAKSATHVVWTTTNANWWSGTEVAGQAYKCSDQRQK